MQELTLREIQLETLKNMKVIAKICDENEIKYCLAFGSLIGAIRHNGFIPWDDDLDIFMSGPDYEKFKTYCFCHKDELKPFELFTPETHSDYPYMIGRFCNTDFNLVAENERPCGMGTFVDIYPLDGFGNDMSFIHKKVKMIKLPASCYFLVSQRHFKPTERNGLNVSKFLLFFIAKILGKKFFYKRLIKNTRLFNYENSKYVACMRWLVDNEKEVFEKSDIENTMLHKFEDAEFNIPVSYNKILSNYYGDYMQLPPIEKRVGQHFYKIYRKNER